ncbi:hypothetical protein [Psychromonas aquimarina]|uniref:hypothetical protein n=1 Tax=Psychromonas aquimarina TaxID=444919 RepID=UPI0012FCDC86|nr:hypothetical protein [Psychromonas aquimarina]
MFKRKTVKPSYIEFESSSYYRDLEITKKNHERKVIAIRLFIGSLIGIGLALISFYM